MSDTEIKKEKKRWYKNLRKKYQLVIFNDETYEKKLSFRITRLNTFLIISFIILFFIGITIYIIAFTSVREYIPGYTDVNLQKKLYALQQKADSLERTFRQKDLYIQNIKNIIEGKNIIETPAENSVREINYDTISQNHSHEDSLLRDEIENKDKYNLYIYDKEDEFSHNLALSNIIFFTPIKGIITNGFNIKERHYGIDISAKKNEAVKATLGGIVIFSDWTIQTGYVIAIQHKNNVVSVYKHNSSLLKEEGEIVKAGDPISIIGESGEQSTGIHLHFELWYNGNPVNPIEYVSF
ncbi:MAG: M23 family metallopeptidase [Bacteroidales bacterium]|nr:M23 family metallopeptidase [Bacteroidales bacterium]